MKRVLCWIIGHDWTGKALEGIPPGRDEPFFEYAAMYCRRCRAPSCRNQGGGPTVNELVGKGRG